MTEARKLFGFVQLDLGGTLAIADGRYVVRSADGEAESVLVVETLGAAPPPRRRRRRPRESAPDPMPESVPLTRVTLVRSSRPFASEDEARGWLDAANDDETVVDDLVSEGLAEINRALHAGAVAGEDPRPQAFDRARATAARVGYGSGEQVAGGAFASAREVDARGGASRRQRRAEELRPQERLAAILGGREQLDACETLLLRARGDLDAGRVRESALQLRAALDAMLAELAGAVDDPDHDDDMAALGARRDAVGAAAQAAIQGDLDATQRETVADSIALGERILRRRRVLRS